MEILAAHGITAKRASALVRSGWLLRLGRGAYGLPGDTLQRDDCLAFLANQVPGLHVAAKTALAWRGVRHNLAYRETVVLWGDQPARLPGWLDGVVRVRYRVAHIFAPELPAGLGLAPLAGGHPELPVSTPERALLELLSETGSTEGLEEVRQLAEGKTLYIHCKMGGRSAKALIALQRHGIEGINVTGGIQAWSQEVDPSVALY